jgi:hypothetical protein
MFFRFIFYTILAYIALRFVRWLISSSSQRTFQSSKREGRTAQMIRCRRCGMFITQSSAILAGGQEFCSDVCARAANRV